MLFSRRGLVAILTMGEKYTVFSGNRKIHVEK